MLPDYGEHRIDYGLLILFESLNDEGKNNEGKKYGIQFVISSTDPSVPLETPEQAFNFVTFFIEILVIFPRLQAIGVGRQTGV